MNGLLIKLSYAQLLFSYSNIGSHVTQGSILTLNKYLLSIYYNTFIIDMSYTFCILKSSFNIFSQIYVNNGKPLIINEHIYYKNYIASQISRVYYHIGKWPPNHVADIKKIFQNKCALFKKTKKNFKKERSLFYFYKNIPSIIFLLNYQDSSSLKSLAYEFRKFKLPLISLVDTEVDIIAINYWALFNNKSKHSILFIQSLIEKLIFKNVLVSKKLFYNKVLFSLWK